MKYCLSAFNTLIFSFAAIGYGTTPDSQYVTLHDGQLVYSEIRNGDIIPDFSSVGFRRSEESIPDIPEVLRIEPDDDAEDDTNRIQRAIDEVGNLPIQENGFRGALYFAPGIYEIDGGLTLRNDGVVLRGGGSGPDGSVLIARGNLRRSLITAGAESEPEELKNTLQYITHDTFAV